MTAGAITEEAQLLLLDPIFHLPSGTVKLIVEDLGSTIELCHYVTRISPTFGMFGLDDDSSLLVPSLSFVLKLSEKSHFATSLLILTVGAFLQLGCRQGRPPKELADSGALIWLSASVKSV